ncbi:hypothetical protein [Candidatus Arthromitus sp. SFB-rat-Yit]|uniref:hypothetical protein n=1 Tax=Candidatus Arthromitus sp. SFB-rat-Yit TaxID=1041504 RepID=UPI000227A395|nr:hypothetical protein [Candidatus Arthromitus sp. SFB-rat-Yit]BAK81490.1 hypothetical protein RATSFB_0928 [Candidatus Arthromitus sp. SFB-rat-Yit]
MFSKDSNFLKGILFLVIGAILLIGGVRMLSSFRVLIYIASILLVYNGITLLKDRYTNSVGKVFIIFGIGMIALFSGISLYFILALAFLGYGIYLLCVKSKVFTNKKGVFKDSRDKVYIKEVFSTLHINGVSRNLSNINVVSFVSNISLDFSNADIMYNQIVDCNIKSYMSEIVLNTDLSWNVLLNGRYIRKIEGVDKTININCKNVLSVIDII